ncbi:hypothetical protein IE81DRAFT_321617 [Ceraceosorus guamensis]|uniref:Uncharacterized protein n=1 Tax=Ceraceosorus guamensis TaxID=1522189 RepID=A0A316W2W9_9BASI|nr:hypothetical protein IE81DRAFT_321617 [Ceraceosorus guamensis]PWN44216.1 hypothetical protein IE81DRAFT_321617 [Ceraceosorus guamensis]
MRSALARALAGSRLSSYDPAVQQIYTAPAASQVRGDFGFKRPLPTVDKTPGTIRYVEVQGMDDVGGQTRWAENEQEVLLKKTWQETSSRLNLGASVNSRAGVLGPRLSSRYDLATIRPLPSDVEANKSLSPEERDQRLFEARDGECPRYSIDDPVYKHTQALDPFDKAGPLYTSRVSMPEDIHSMSEKEFERHLGKIRRQRAAYLESHRVQLRRRAQQHAWDQYDQHRKRIASEATILASRGEQPPEIPPEKNLEDIPVPEVGEVDAWNLSRGADRVSWSRWLERQTELALAGPNATQLNPRGTPRHVVHDIRDRYAPRQPPRFPMHPFGGLQYGQPDKIQTALLASPVPGRLINSSQPGSGVTGNPSRARGVRADGFALGVGGRIAKLPKVHAEERVKGVDFNKAEPSQGELGVRIFEAHVSRTHDREAGGPRKHSHLTNEALGCIHMDARAADHATGTKLAIGVPGSREWVGQVDGNSRYVSVADIADQGAPGGMYSEGEQRRANARQTRARSHRRGRRAIEDDTSRLLDSLYERR